MRRPRSWAAAWPAAAPPSRPPTGPRPRASGCAWWRRPPSSAPARWPWACPPSTCTWACSWGENTPEDFVRYVRQDLMGLSREDLVYDLARHVDSSVHMFEEWGLPIFKTEDGKYKREGRWQIMIHGESYKPIVAEAAKAGHRRGERLRAGLRGPPPPRRRRPHPHRRRGRLLRAGLQGHRLQGQGRHQLRRRRHRRVPPPGPGRGPRPHLVRPLEHRLGLRACRSGPGPR